MADAMIWGASGGMGQALTNKLVKQGWRVFAAGRHDENIPEGVERSYQFDALKETSIRDIALDLAFEGAEIDLWVYFAGELHAEQFSKMTAAGWWTNMRSNLDGAFFAINQTTPLLTSDAQVVFIGAYIDHLILPKMGAYAAAKAALETFAAVLQKENRKLNVTVVKPGAVDTPFWENAPFRLPRDAKSPDTIADAILAQYQGKQRGTLEL